MADGLTVATAIERFTSEARKKLRAIAAKGEPEDQIRSPLEALIGDLADLAGTGPRRSGDIAAALGVKVESIAPRRSGLIGKGMIYSPAHGDTAFTVPLFDEFLKRAVPRDR